MKRCGVMIRRCLLIFPSRLRREIVGSYCPGSYDLSIDGKKFAGISQRRLKKGSPSKFIYVSMAAAVSGQRQLKNFMSIVKKKRKPSMCIQILFQHVMSSLADLLETRINDPRCDAYVFKSTYNQSLEGFLRGH